MVFAALGSNASARARNRIRQATRSLEGVCFYNCVGLACHVPLRGYQNLCLTRDLWGSLCDSKIFWVTRIFPHLSAF